LEISKIDHEDALSITVDIFTGAGRFLLPEVPHVLDLPGKHVVPAVRVRAPAIRSRNGTGDHVGKLNKAIPT
jgi:hypothetical protein